MLIKLFLFFLWIFLIPLIIGCALTEQNKSHKGCLITSYFYGIFAEFALFELITVPMIFLKCSLSQLEYIWIILTIILLILSLFRCRSFPSVRKWLRSVPDKITLLIVIAILFVLLQAVLVTLNQHLDSDDAYYVATSLTAVQTDTLMEYDPYTGELYEQLPSRYVLAAWPLYFSLLSVLTGFHPTLIAHLLMPGPIIIFTYLVYYLISRELFPGQKNRQALFLLFVSLIICFSGFSIYTSGTFLIIRSWQGKALVAAVVQPALFYICRCAMKGNEGFSAWLCLFCIVTSACLFSSMGVMLSIIPTCVYTIIYTLRQHKWQFIPQSLLSCLAAFGYGAAYLFIK